MHAIAGKESVCAGERHHGCRPLNFKANASIESMRDSILAVISPSILRKKCTSVPEVGPRLAHTVAKERSEKKLNSTGRSERQIY